MSFTIESVPHMFHTLSTRLAKFILLSIMFMPCKLIKSHLAERENKFKSSRGPLLMYQVQSSFYFLPFEQHQGFTSHFLKRLSIFDVNQRTPCHIVFLIIHLPHFPSAMIVLVFFSLFNTSNNLAYSKLPRSTSLTHTFANMILPKTEDIHSRKI